MTWHKATTTTTINWAGITRGSSPITFSFTTRTNLLIVDILNERASTVLVRGWLSWSRWSCRLWVGTARPASLRSWTWTRPSHFLCSAAIRWGRTLAGRFASTTPVLPPSPSLLPGRIAWKLRLSVRWLREWVVTEDEVGEGGVGEEVGWGISFQVYQYLCLR